MNIGNNFKKDLGVRNGKLTALATKPNCVSSQASNASKRVDPLKYSVDLQEQMDKVVHVISSMSGAEIMQKSDNYVYAVFTTKLMRFKDDFEVYLDDESKTLHFRSASRVGYSDLGVNRKRYEAVVAKL